MSRILPIELKYAILSYLPLSHFCGLKYVPSLWDFRYLMHFGINTNKADKKIQLLRAATEEHEVCTETLTLYNNPNYLDLIYYYAALAKNWPLVQLSADSNFQTDILIAAIEDNQLEVVTELLYIRQSHNTDNEISYYHGTGKILKLTPNMIQVLMPDLNQLPDDVQAQVMAAVNLPSYKQFVRGHPRLAHTILERTLAAYKYNSNIEDKINFVNGYLGYTAGGNTLYFYNRIGNARDDASKIKTLEWFNTAGMGDWLATFLIDDVTILDFMQRHYDYIPDARSRALETIKILESYSDQNSLLLRYVAFVRMVIGTLTLDDFEFLPDFNGYMLGIVLANKQFDLILELDKLMIKNKADKISLINYTFTDPVTLEVVLRCKSITIGEGRSWMRIFTLPLLRSLLDLLGKDRILIQEAKAYIPDCVELAQKI